MQKGFGLIGILLVIGIIAVLGVGALKMISPDKNPFVPSEEEKSAIEMAEQVKNTVESRSTNDESREEKKVDTSDWKTYHNEEYGFEFKYDPSFTVEEHVAGSINEGALDIRTPSMYIKVGKEDSQGNLDIQVRTIGLACDVGHVDRDVWRVETILPFKTREIFIAGKKFILQAESADVSDAGGETSWPYGLHLCDSSGRVCFFFYGQALFDVMDIGILESFRITKPLDAWDEKKCIFDAGDIRDQS